MAIGTLVSIPDSHESDGGAWVMPRDTEQALGFVERAGFNGRPGLCVWRTEHDRALVTDLERGAYTIFAVYTGDTEAVRIFEEPGWAA